MTDKPAAPMPTLETWGHGRRPSFVLEIPMHGLMAQFVLPRDLKASEAERLCAMIKTLILLDDLRKENRNE